MSRFFFLASLVLLSITGELPGQTQLQIHYINVGQGSSTLIVGPTGISCLVDGGEFGEGYSSVVPRLMAAGVASLDYMVLTHYHTDHWGGLPEVISSGFAPTIAYDRGNASITGSINSYLGAVGGARTTMTPGTVINLGGGATITCVCANGNVMGGGSVNVTVGNQLENSRSIGLRLDYGGFQQSLCGDLTGGGDATPDVESAAAGVMGDVDVMVMNHHGSFTSTNQTWVNALKPEITICSCGQVSPYGHPHASPTNRVLSQATHVEFYRLNQGSSTPGGVVVGADLSLSTDGTQYTVSGGAIAPITYSVDQGGGPPPTLQQSIPGDIVVSEYMQNPSAVSDGNGEWLELFNTTGDSINLQGFSIEDQDFDGFVLPGLTIPARGYLVFGNDGNPASNGGVGVDYVWPASSFFLANGSDEILIKDSTGHLLDMVAYDNGATFPDPNGASVERADLAAVAWASNFHVSTSPFGVGDLGTPGSPNTGDITQPWVPLAAPPQLTIGAWNPVFIQGGFAHGGLPYVLGISECATPGITLLASGRQVDVCLTDLLLLSVSGSLPIFQNFTGTLNAQGQGGASIWAPALPGLELTMTGLVLDNASPDGVLSVIDNERLIFP